MINYFKNRKYMILLFLLGFVGSFVYFYLYLTKTKVSEQKTVLSAKANLPVWFEDKLKQYNGTDPKKPIYIGLDGYVYDVTMGRKFYQTGGAYHYLAGKDSSNELKIFGAGIIKRKYPIVAVLKK